MIKRAAALSWNMVTLIPPAISSTTDIYNKKYHEKKRAEWKAKKGKPFDLVYYRPILFFGSDHVGVEGRVGSRVSDKYTNIGGESDDDSINELEEGNENEKEESGSSVVDNEAGPVQSTYSSRSTINEGDEGGGTVDDGNGEAGSTVHMDDEQGGSCFNKESSSTMYTVDNGSTIVDNEEGGFTTTYNKVGGFNNKRETCTADDKEGDSTMADNEDVITEDKKGEGTLTHNEHDSSSASEENNIKTSMDSCSAEETV